jgi:PTS system mannose-specific IIA component
MIGVVIVAHLQLAEELLKAAEMITDSTLDNFRTVSINPNDDPDQASKKVVTAVKSVDKGSGVLIFVDMFGGTPSNLSLSLLDKGKTEIVTGVNLPMIVEAAHSSQAASFNELAINITSVGQKGIRSASEILNKKIVDRKES